VLEYPQGGSKSTRERRPPAVVPAKAEHPFERP
jgi:hypothetical protein